MNIHIKVIDHQEQRYPTVGDWQYDKNGDLHIHVSRMSDWRYELLVARHELEEAVLCKQMGIEQKAVDEFDLEFERQRDKGLVLSTAEPGDHRFAPYRHPHNYATGSERMMAHALGVEWADYELELNGL